MPTTAPATSSKARAPDPKPPGCAQARKRGGRLAWVLGRNAKGWIAVELDGNANEEGKAYERKSLRWAQFAPGQDSILAALRRAQSAGAAAAAAARGGNRSRRSGRRTRAHRPP